MPVIYFLISAHKDGCGAKWLPCITNTNAAQGMVDHAPRPLPRCLPLSSSPSHYFRPLHRCRFSNDSSLLHHMLKQHHRITLCILNCHELGLFFLSPCACIMHAGEIGHWKCSALHACVFLCEIHQWQGLAGMKSLHH